MNITKLVASLQKAANTSTTTAELANLSRAIKGLNVGTVQTVANTASLPAMLPTNGNLYYVESEEDLYYNVGGTWNALTTALYPLSRWGRLYVLFPQPSSPTSIDGDPKNWVQISSGKTHSTGVTSTGIAYAWGTNNYGQLGSGSTVSSLSPVTVVGGITNWARVSAGGGFSLGITTSGIAYAWGGNGSVGKLGDGSLTSRSSPVTVVGGITNWAQIHAGQEHSLGLTSSGIAYAWGFNSGGQLGDGTVTSRLSPVSVIGGITNWSKASINRHNLALTSTGIAYSWGYNFAGQLGNNTTTSSRSPVTVVGGITNWSQLGAGGAHSIGLIATGIVYSWGYNSDGQLGDNTTSSRISPVTVTGGITNWSQVASGWYHSLALTSTGTAYTWGRNSTNQLGDGTDIAKSSPVTVVGGITTWSQLSAGYQHSLAFSTTFI